MNEPHAQGPNRARMQFIVLVLIFAAPIVGATLLYFIYPSWTPEGRVNYGALVEPAVPVPPLTLIGPDGAPAPAPLQRKWSLVVIGGADCDEACRRNLFLTRQVRTRLHKHEPRVRRVYIAPGAEAMQRVRDALAGEHPDLVFLADEGAPGSRAADFFGQGALFLVDPLGNWMMRYDQPLEAHGLYRDLKKLMKFSQVG